MKEEFGNYYTPTQTQEIQAWRDARFVIDSNVLLSLYRVPGPTRNEILDLLEKLGNRLWIPYHVALEFHRNRLAVISGYKKESDELLGAVRTSLKHVRQTLQDLRIGASGSFSGLIDEVDSLRSNVDSALQAGLADRIAVSGPDSILDRLDILLGGRIGPPPINQQALDSLFSEGERRYSKNVPPGFADSSKGKNASKAWYVDRGLEYDARFGDLVIWNQVLEYARLHASSLIFVTADIKDDWWRFVGKTRIGPHVSLLEEARNVGVEQFMMYTLVEFLQKATTHLDADFSSHSLEIVRGLAEIAAGELLPEVDAEVAKAVVSWLSSNGDAIESQGEFPPYIDKGSRAGFGIVSSDSGDSYAMGVEELLTQGRWAVESGSLATFSLVIVADRGWMTFMHARIGISNEGWQNSVDWQRVKEDLARETARRVLKGLRVVIGFVEEGVFQSFLSVDRREE